MKLIFKNIKDSPRNLIRRAGYHFEKINPSTKEEGYARRLSSGDYPKFHAYIKKEGSDLIMNLHLDQKRPSYNHSTAHSGEYEESEVLNKEADRIKDIIATKQ